RARRRRRAGRRRGGGCLEGRDQRADAGVVHDRLHRRIVLKRLLAIVSWAALELREAPAGRVPAAIELRPRLVEATAGVGVVGVPRGVRPFVAFEQPLELLRGAFEFSSAATSLVDRSWVDGGHDLAHARTDETLDGPRIAGIDACRGGRE